MVIKLIGFFLVFGGSLFAGAAESSRRARSYNELCGILELVRHMADGIRFSRARLDGLFASFDNAALRECGFLDALCESKTVNGCRIRWEKALTNVSLSANAHNLCSELGTSLGTLPLESQIKALERVLDGLEEEKNLCRKALERDKRVIFSVSSMVGLAAAIILL